MTDNIPESKRMPRGDGLIHTNEGGPLSGFVLNHSASRPRPNNSVNPTYRDAVFSRLDSNGTLLWSRDESY